MLNDLVGRTDMFENQMQTMGIDDPEEIRTMMEAGTAGQRAIRSVNATRSILSSLIMPLAAFAAAFVIFLRRDY